MGGELLEEGPRRQGAEGFGRGAGEQRQGAHPLKIGSSHRYRGFPPAFLLARIANAALMQINRRRPSAVWFVRLIFIKCRAEIRQSEVLLISPA